MIKLKDLLNEKVEDVQWVGKAYNLAIHSRKFPITPKIADMFYKGERVRAFHITSINKIEALKSIAGSKKSISTMSRVPSDKFNDGRIQGIWQDGVLFYLEGTLMLDAATDIMSEPDEQGRRWVGFDAVEGGIDEAWNESVDRDSVLKKLVNQLKGKEVLPDKNEIYRKYLDRYIKLAEAFAKQNKLAIIAEFSNFGIDHGNFLIISNGNYNEILLNKVKLIDVLWDGRIGSGKQVVGPGKIRESYIKKLQSMVSGKVIAPYPFKKSDGKKFVSTRKGTII